MDLDFNSSYLDLKQVIEISRGDTEKVNSYLRQFLILIPERLLRMQEAMEEGDREKIRRVIHNMSPQIQFFGIPNISEYISQIELGFESMPVEEMQQIVENITKSLSLALEEVKTVLQQTG